MAHANQRHGLRRQGAGHGFQGCGQRSAVVEHVDDFRRPPPHPAAAFVPEGGKGRLQRHRSLGRRAHEGQQGILLRRHLLAIGHGDDDGQGREPEDRQSGQDQASTDHEAHDRQDPRENTNGGCVFRFAIARRGTGEPSSHHEHQNAQQKDQSRGEHQGIDHIVVHQEPTLPPDRFEIKEINGISNAMIMKPTNVTMII